MKNIAQNFTNEKYISYLESDNFNDEQIKLLIKQVNNYATLKESEYFDYDTYERDMWYTMNRSGLFEHDQENKTDITDWGPNETRCYISECRYLDL